MLNQPPHPRRAPSRRLSEQLGPAGIVATCVLLWSACGSRTGLEVPDVSLDAAVDAAIIVPPEVPCILLPPDPLSNVVVDLQTEARLRRADVVFLIDTTRSMSQEIAAIRTRLRDRIAPAVFAEIPDTHFAVATFADFPVAPYGDPGDIPFAMLRQLTGDLSEVQGALDLIRLHVGGDPREAQIEALYQVATGDGLGAYIAPSFGCPRGGTGGACFRDGALPVILLFTDAPMHGGPVSGSPYGPSIVPRPHTYEEAIAVLNRQQIRVLGLWSNSNSAFREDLEHVVRDTGGLDEQGRPIVFNIGTNGEQLDTGVADVLRQYARAVIFDIGARPVDPTPGDGVDVTSFIESITPLRAEPMDGISRINPDAGTFEGVLSGTRVVFQVTLRGGSHVPGPTAQRFRLQVDFRSEGTTLIDTGFVDIVVPGMDGTGCEAFAMPP